MQLSLVDYHCHLDLFPSFEEAINLCEQNKIYTLTVTTTPLAWPRNHELTLESKYVKCALGLHPQLIHERASEISLWKKYFLEARFIGEIGLDGGPQFYKSLPDQVKIFEYILRCCAEAGNKILTIHSVRSVPKILDLLQTTKVMYGNKIILHWFTGTISQAKEAVDIGCFFSVNTEMLKNERHVRMLNSLPKNRVITETDSPFTFKGDKFNTPSDVSDSINSLSNFWSMTTEEVQISILNTLSVIVC